MGRDRGYRFSFLKINRKSIISFFVIFLLIFSSNVILSDNTNTLFDVYPKEKYVKPGDIFTVDVNCVPSQPIKAFELDLRFDPSVIQAINVTEGDIFNGYTTFFNPGVINNFNGSISEIYGLILGPGNISSSGSLIHVSFMAKDNVASSTIELVDVGATNEISYVPFSVSNGMVYVDTVLPLVIDNSPSKGFTGDQFVFNATVTDFNNSNNLTVMVDWSHGSLSGNISMNYDGGTYFTKTVTLDKNSVNNLYYKFYAVDSYGDSFTTKEYFVPVFDNDPPIIDSISSTPSVKEIGKYVNISAKITDNILINNAFLNLIYPNSYSENFSVKKNNSGNFYFSNKTYNLPGSYSFYFWAKDTNNNSIASNVYNFEVTGNTIPVLSFNPTSYNFGNKIKGVSDSTTFKIFNSGTGILSYSLSENSNWITSVTPKTGTSTGEHDIITIKIDTSGLNIGLYSYNISINSNGGNKIFTVSVNIVSPTEQLDQQQNRYDNKFTIYSNNWIAQSFKPSVNKLTSIELYINKKGNPNTDIIASIRNSLTGSDLVVSSKPANQISSSINWVKFDFNDITVTPENTYYIILRTNGGSSTNYYEWGFGYYTAYTRGLFFKSSYSGSSWGEYSYYDLCFKTYGASTGSTSPVLSINPSSYTFTGMQKGITSSTTFEIWNSGAGTLSYSLNENSNWITSISPNTGTSTGEHDTITIKIDTKELNTGLYTYDIPISSNAGSKIFTISITIIPPAPLLYYSPSSYNFGNKIKGISDSTTFEIWNSGTGTLSYSLSDTCNWITSIIPASGTSTGEHDTITIKIDTKELNTGLYTYDIPINTNGGNKTFTVSINIVTSTEKLDQQQIRYENKFTIYSNNWIAQSFKPSVNKLTSIELYINKKGNPNTDIIASIRNSLTGPDLVVSSVPASQIPTTINWVKFDFNDITVTPENTYYIVLRTSSGNNINYYECGFAYFTEYTSGLFCRSSNSGASWNEYTYYDLCFKTYGET